MFWDQYKFNSIDSIYSIIYFSIYIYLILNIEMYISLPSKNSNIVK